MVPVDDEELARLALAADPDQAVPPDAVPLRFGADATALLPGWYMPPPTSRRRLRGWRRALAVLVVASFLLIDAYGLCSTYGWVELA